MHSSVIPILMEMEKMQLATFLLSDCLRKYAVHYAQFSCPSVQQYHLLFGRWLACYVHSIPELSQLVSSPATDYPLQGRVLCPGQLYVGSSTLTQAFDTFTGPFVEFDNTITLGSSSRMTINVQGFVTFQKKSRSAKLGIYQGYTPMLNPFK